MHRNERRTIVKKLMVTALFAALFAVPVLAAEEKPTEWNFDKDSLGQMPTGWKAGFTNSAKGQATWTVTKDDKAPTAPNVVTLDAKSGGGTFNLAIAERTSFKDVDLSVKIKAHSGKEDQGGGLIWRTKDDNNYYICRMNPLENNFRVYKVTGGKRRQLDSADVKLETGKWYEVRAKMVGSHILCYIDGKQLLNATDDAIKDAGVVGLWTKADASLSFDNIAVKPGEVSKDDQAAAKPTDTEKKKPEKDDDDDD